MLKSPLSNRRITNRKGDVNALIDRINKQKSLGNIYKAIFIETYRPKEYNTNKYLIDNKVTTVKYILIQSNTILKDNILFDEIVPKEQFVYEIKNLLQKYVITV